jgi:hypothetical protein
MDTKKTQALCAFFVSFVLFVVNQLENEANEKKYGSALFGSISGKQVALHFRHGFW